MSAAAARFRLERNGADVLGLSGAITFDNAAQALSAVSAAAAQRSEPLDVDLSGLLDADSATLAVLIAWAAQTGGLRYLNAPTALRNLARLSDVESLLHLS